MCEEFTIVNGFIKLKDLFPMESTTLRINGYTRPLSVLQIKADARNKYAKMGKKTMEDMLTPRGIIFGCICALFSADNCSS